MNRNLGIVDQIYGMYGALTETEQRVADYIVRHLVETTYLSVREIARESMSSPATVSRFVKSLGFDSFANLRLALAAEASRASEAPAADVAKEVDADDIRGSVEFILATKVQELRSTVAAINEDEMKRAIQLILNANNVVFGAVGNSIPICENLSFKFGQIGIRSFCGATSESMILSSMALRHDDVLILISSSGYSKRLEVMVDNAEDANAPVIFITSNPTSSLAERSTVVLQAVSGDQMLSGVQFSSHVPFDFLAETIFALTLSSVQFASQRTQIEHKSLGFDKDLPVTIG